MSTWMEKAERAQTSLANLRKASAAALPKVIHDSEAIGGGLLMGLIRGAAEATGKDYSIPGPNGIKIPPEVPVGLLFLATALSGQTPVSDDLHAIGAGVLAYSAGREAENFMRLRAANAKIKAGEVQ